MEVFALTNKLFSLVFNNIYCEKRFNSRFFQMTDNVFHNCIIAVGEKNYFRLYNLYFLIIYILRTIKYM